MTKVLYTGSFDPITKGHMHIVNQASSLFDEVVIAVLHNSSKKSGLFSIEERVDMLKEIYKNTPNITIITSTDAAVDVALSNGCQAIVRGIRNSNDYDYEAQLSQINKDISNNKVNTICLFSDKEYQFISSSVVKEIFNLNKDISNYVSPYVKQKMIERRMK